MTGIELACGLAIAVMPVVVAELFADRRHQREHSSDEKLQEKVTQLGRKLDDQARQVAALRTDLLAVETALATLLARGAEVGPGGPGRGRRGNLTKGGGDS